MSISPSNGYTYIHKGNALTYVYTGYVQQPDIAYKEFTRRGGRMSRASIAHGGRSRYPDLVGSNPDPVGSNPGRVKPMTLKLRLFTSYTGTRRY